ncbi:MAG: 7-cyano-7-deazaguanine reductase [Candidatus Endobugula sp.]|jgi:7-cyano-7-deazaguanine reductase
MSIENPLGHHTSYPTQYDASLLFPIKRTVSRDKLSLGDELPFRGSDRWTAYEVSWIDTSGKPQIRVAEFILDSQSPNIIESKSFKLYLNSFNQTTFASEGDVKSKMAIDLSAVAGAPVLVSLQSLHYAKGLLIAEPIGACLDELTVDIRHYQPAPELLSVSETKKVNEVVFSHLLKTNCPVTDQPDWATIFIEYSGFQISHESLLAYIISFRDHQDFHENSVERLYCDMQQYCRPESLAVYARYTRRGGLDINPLRTSYPSGRSLLEANTLRMLRQ